MRRKLSLFMILVVARLIFHLGISNGYLKCYQQTAILILGGDDFDHAIVKHWIDQKGIKEEELKIHKNLAQEFRLKAEEAKKHLSNNENFKGEAGGEIS